MIIGDGHDLKSKRFAGDEVLEACYDNEKVLRRGDSGPAVEKVQEALIALGFPVPNVGVNGVFGDETELAVRSYQEARGLNVDGIVGSETIGNLDEEFYFGPLEPSVVVAPEPHVSEIRTPLEPESPVRPPRASPVEPVRAPEVPKVRAPPVPEVKAPPVPKPEVPVLATEVTKHEHRRTHHISRQETPSAALRPEQAGSMEQRFHSEGTWSGNSSLEAEAGMFIHFNIVSLNTTRSKVRIKANTGESREYLLMPGVTVYVDFTREGEESFIWKFDVETDSEKSIIDWKLYSDWVPAFPGELSR